MSGSLDPRRGGATRRGKTLASFAAWGTLAALGLIASAIAFSRPSDQAPIRVNHNPVESRLVRGSPFRGDLRNLPPGKSKQKDRPEREGPETVPVPYGTPDLLPDGAAP